MLLPVIISSLVLVQNVVTTSSEPPTEKVSGPNDPQIITSPAYIANNTEFERTCKIYGGDDLPGLVWQDEDGNDIANNPPRIIIELTKDTVKNTTIGIFKLKPALVEDNKFKKITCRNTKQGRSKHFNLKVISDQSVPEISVNNGVKELKKLEGDTVQLQCTMSGKPSGIVKRYSLTWAVKEINNAGCYNEQPALKISNSEIEPMKKINGTLISILKLKGLNMAHANKYFCIACLHLIGDEIGSFNAFVDLLVKKIPNVKKEVRAEKGTSAELDCEADGKSTATWVRVSHWDGEVVHIPADNASIVNNRFNFKPKLGSAPNSILEISNVQISDRAVYRCSVQFPEQNVTKEFTLRVNDRRGFYWPVAGMFGEATLLFLIIVICDSYHQKKRLRENPPPPVSEEDEAGVTEGLPLMNNGVPQPLPVTEVLA